MQTSLVKKIVAVLTSGAMVLAAVPFVAQAALHGVGTNVNIGGTVYFLDGTSKRPYTSAGAFLSYGFNSWSGVVAASAEDQALPTGAFIPAADGSLINDHGTVWLITNGTKAGFTSAANFLGLGYSFSNVIVGDVSFMSQAALINSTAIAHPAGTLVNQSGTVYLMSNTGKQGIPSLAVFNSWGYSFNNVVVANSYDSAVAMSNGVMPAFSVGCLSPLSCSGTTVITPSGNVSVTAASDMPAAGTLVSGQSGADLAHFVFSGTGTVTNVTLKRIGVSADATLVNVYLYSGATRLTDAASVTNGTIVFNNANGLFTVSGSTPISVHADIATSTSGQTLGVQLWSAMTGSTAVGGSQVSGNIFTIASVSNLATLTFSASSVSSVTVNAGQKNFTVFGNPITVGNRSVWLKGITFKYIGSAPTSSLANIGLFVNGNQISTGTINSNNLLVFDLSSNPYTIQTGASTLEVHADIVNGSNRNFTLSVQNSADITAVDSQYNVPVTPASLSNAVAGTITISTGTMTVTLDPAFNATLVTGGASQVPVARYLLQSYGEDIKVNSFTVTPALSGTTPAAAGLNNVSLFLNGNQVGSSQNWTSGALTFTFGSSLIVSANTISKLEVRADTQTSGNAAYTAGTVTMTLGGATSNAQGQSSQQLITVNPALASNPLTFSSGALTVALNTGYLSQTVVANQSGVKLGSFILQSNSSEPVRVTNLSINLTVSGAPFVITNITNLRTSETSGSGATPIGNPAATNNNFAVNFTLQPSTNKQIDIIGDLGTATSGNVFSTLTVTGTGAISNQSVTPGAVTGQTITASAGGLGTTTVAPSSANPMLVASAATPTAGPANAYGFNFVSNVGTTTITELRFAITHKASTAAYGASACPVTTVTVGGVSAPVTSMTNTNTDLNASTNTATSQALPFLDSSSAAGAGKNTATNCVADVTGLNLQIPVGVAGLDVNVTPIFNFVGTNGMATDKDAMVRLIGIRSQSGNTVVDTAGSSFTNVNSNTHYIFASVPTVAVDTVAPIQPLASGAVASAGTSVFRFTIAASATGPLNVKQIAFTPFWSGSLTNAATDGVQLYDLTADPGQTNNLTAGNLALTSGTQSAIVLTNNLVVPAGQSKTLLIKADTTGLTSTGNSFRVDLTATGEAFAAVGAAGSNIWAWNDYTVTGNNYVNGFLVKNLTLTGPTLTR